MLGHDTKQAMFKHMANAAKCQTDSAVQNIMRPDLKYSAPTPASQFQGAAATEWVLHYVKEGLADKGVRLGSCWLSCLMGMGWMVASNLKVYMVLASAEYGFLGWQLQQVLELSEDHMSFSLLGPGKPIVWLFCTSLTEWVVFPYTVCFEQTQGLVFQISGEATALVEYAIMIGGLNMSNGQMQQLIEALGGTPQTPFKHENLCAQLAKALFPTDDFAQQQALDKLLKKPSTQAERLDSKMNTVLQSVVEEMDVVNSSELQEERDVIKAKRARTTAAADVATAGWSLTNLYVCIH